MKKALALILALMMCTVLLFSGCSKEKDFTTKDDANLNDTVVATVDGVNISQADFNFLYKMLFDEMSQYAQYYGESWLDQQIDEDGTTIGQYIKKNALEQHKQLIVATKLAEENKIDLDNLKDVVKQNKENVVNNYGGEEGYLSFLKECRTTDKTIDTYLERTEIYSRVYEKLSGEGGVAYVNDDEVVKEFAESYLTVKHILISTQEQTDENGNVVPAKSEEEAQKIVSEVIGKIEAGEDFDKLIDEYDEDPGMTSGSFYTFTDGEMVPEFEEASKNLKVGEFTKEAVKTDYGYHIIKKYDVNTEDENYTNFKQRKAAEKFNGVITKKLEGLKVTSKDDVIDKYIESWSKELKEALASTMQQPQTPIMPETEAPAEEAPAEEAPAAE